MIKTIDREALKKFLDSQDPSAKIVDVLDENHFAQEHIRGAISLPLGKIEKYANVRLNKEDKIIVYCANTECQASPKAAAKLESMGFKNIFDYEEGLKGYKEANLPLEGSLHPKVEAASGQSCCE